MIKKNYKKCKNQGIQIKIMQEEEDAVVAEQIEENQVVVEEEEQKEVVVEVEYPKNEYQAKPYD